MKPHPLRMILTVEQGREIERLIADAVIHEVKGMAEKELLTDILDWHSVKGIEHLSATQAEETIKWLKRP